MTNKFSGFILDNEAYYYVDYRLPRAEAEPSLGGFCILGHETSLFSNDHGILPNLGFILPNLGNTPSGFCITIKRGDIGFRPYEVSFCIMRGLSLGTLRERPSLYIENERHN